MIAPLALLVAACGGGGSGPSSPTTPTAPPAAEVAIVVDAGRTRQTAPRTSRSP